MKTLRHLTTALLCCSVAIGPATAVAGGAKYKESKKKRQQHEFEIRKNPATGTIPAGIRRAELRHAAAMRNTGDSFIQSEQWRSYGPGTIGGRTRMVAIDSRNPDIIIAGGVAGGMWRSVDRGVSWTMTTPPEEMPAVMSLIQHPTNPDVWYFSTGEYQGTAGAGPGGGSNLFPRHPGGGLWKSVDNGVTWTKLEATVPSGPAGFERFTYGWRLVIDIRDGVETLYSAGLGGILRSTDEGASWTPALAVDPAEPLAALPAMNDIVLAGNGMKYVAISSVTVSETSTYNDEELSPLGGIYRSEDGTGWENITPQELAGTAFARTVFAVAPSNPDYVYMMAHVINNPNAVSTNVGGKPQQGDFMLFRSTDGGSSWTNLSPALTAEGSPMHQRELPTTQEGYNMTLAVSPANPEIVTLGLTNMYASDEGFTSPTSIRWIGGYNPFSEMPDDDNDPTIFEKWKDMSYPMAGWDHHYTVFHPSAPNAVLIACDAGVRYTSDIFRQDTVLWQNLNNGFLTSQFYSVSINPIKAGDGTVIGGMQDNSSFGTRDGNSWQWLSGGDGCTGVIFNDSLMISSSQQGGFVAVQSPTDNFDDSDTRRKFLPQAPAAGFIVPIERNPFDTEQPSAYVLTANGLGFYNDIYSAEPSLGLSSAFEQFGSTLWSALAVSQQTKGKAWVANAQGKVFRWQADETTEEETITELTGNNFPQGYITCVAVDPYDDNHIGVVFSNYGIPSVFFSQDGGQTWSDVSGTIEENADGSGNGPSVRWLTITGQGEAKRYLLGTSVGLYSATSLVAGNTQWKKEGASSIGSAVVTMIRAREADGFVAVATHGSGIFVNNVGTDVVEYPSQSAPWIQPPYPVPAQSSLTFSVHTATPTSVNVKLVDARGTQVLSGRYAAGEQDGKITLSLENIPQGVYFLRVEAGSKVSTFTVPVVR